MSVTAVAQEAGVSDTLIHNQYPAQLERIRGGQDREMKRQRDEARTKLKAERQKNRELRDQLDKLTLGLQEMTSKNATIGKELHELRAISNSGNVTSFRPKKA